MTIIGRNWSGCAAAQPRQPDVPHRKRPPWVTLGNQTTSSPGRGRLIYQNITNSAEPSSPNPVHGLTGKSGVDNVATCTCRRFTRRRSWTSISGIHPDPGAWCSLDRRVAGLGLGGRDPRHPDEGLYLADGLL